MPRKTEQLVGMEDDQQQTNVLNNKWSSILSLFLFSVAAHTFINKVIERVDV